MSPKPATVPVAPVKPAAPAPVVSVVKAPVVLTFKVETRPEHVRGIGPTMTPLHDAILDTLTTGKAVSVPIPSGKTAVQVQRICRYPLIKLDKLKGLTFRRVVSVDHVKVWIEAKKAPRLVTPEQRAKNLARQEASRQKRLATLTPEKRAASEARFQKLRAAKAAKLAAAAK